MSEMHAQRKLAPAEAAMTPVEQIKMAAEHMIFASVAAQAAQQCIGKPSDTASVAATMVAEMCAQLDEALTLGRALLAEMKPEAEI